MNYFLVVFFCDFVFKVVEFGFNVVFVYFYDFNVEEIFEVDEVFRFE